MKNLAMVIILSGLVFFSCKKKDNKDAETPTPPPVVAPPPVVPDEFSVKVDGVDYNCKNCSSTFLTGGLRGVYFGDQNTSTKLFQFHFATMPAVGTYQLKEDSDPKMTFVKEFTYYKVTSGVLTITAVDTSSKGTIKKLIGTFTAKTDTTYGPQYPIFKLTDGVLNLDYK